MTATDVGVRRLIPDVDWSTTALGPREEWPPCLAAAFSTILASDAPMLLLAGPEHVLLWNAAWKRLVDGASHRDLGRLRLRDMPQLQALQSLVQAVQTDPTQRGARALLLGGSPHDVLAVPLRCPDDLLRGILIIMTPSPASDGLDDPGRFAAIVASADDAILSVDRDLRIVSWNGGARRLYGYDADEVLGQPVWMLSRRPDEDRTALDLVLRGQRQPSRNVVRWRKDGSVVHVSLAVSPVLDPQGQIIGAAHIARDGTASHDVERLHRLLVGEMKHRVKNILSTVQAIARQTLGSERTAAYESFEKRILALGRAQDLITRDTSEGVDLQAVVAAVLSPFPQGQITQDGPNLRFSSRAAVALTLGLHELATNALKYGALSLPDGQVRVTWSVNATPVETFVLHWRESGGPPVARTQHKGFGSVLILDVLAAELQGEVDLRLQPDGAECDITAPMAAVREQVL
ncbi:PAS domain S-box protein [Tabrizicola aquatica]|uniref:PAS domain S-box protein n=1 Tax=Tabrizicola aquatica TaxID=909926 RepID=UPI0011AF69CB|nr:PAS domain S-box protein [Tabrizicola aquatica]